MMSTRRVECFGGPLDGEFYSLSDMADEVILDLGNSMPVSYRARTAKELTESVKSFMDPQNGRKGVYEVRYVSDGPDHVKQTLHWIGER
jgi:hypothetical protein